MWGIKTKYQKLSERVGELEYKVRNLEAYATKYHYQDEEQRKEMEKHQVAYPPIYYYLDVQEMFTLLLNHLGLKLKYIKRPASSHELVGK